MLCVLETAVCRAPLPSCMLFFFSQTRGSPAAARTADPYGTLPRPYLKRPAQTPDQSSSPAFERQPVSFEDS